MKGKIHPLDFLGLEFPITGADGGGGTDDPEPEFAEKAMVGSFTCATSSSLDNAS